MASRRQRSSIDKLPEEVRAEIGELLERRNLTIDQVLAHLRQLDVPEAQEISRSALGRHAKKLSEIGERMRHSREMALALVDRFGDQPDNKLARVNLELMHGVVMQTITGALDGGEYGEAGPVTFDPESVKFLAGALASLAQAQKTDTDRMAKLKAELAKESAGKLDVARQAGEIDAEAVERAKRILGFG
jgi:hypothetical protein